MRGIWQAAIVLLLAAPCAAWPAEPAQLTQEEAEAAAHNPLEVTYLDPLGFLEHLKGMNRDFAVVTFHLPVKGWIREQHLPALIELLDSTEPCAAVVHARSSFWPQRSTVGAEAALMIAGFRDGHYPSALHAANVDANQLREWWANGGNRPGKEILIRMPWDH